MTADKPKKPTRTLLRRIRDRLKRLVGRQAGLARRVKAIKQARAASPHAYTDHPKLSLILLSFNHRANITPILERLRRTSAEELIVCEDGSIDGSLETWLRYLTRPNEFLIRSNDIHEIRAYNRAIGFARGEFVCVLQDDDIPPEDGLWVDDAMALFDRYPKLGILGCFQGLALDFSGPIEQIRARWSFGYRLAEIPSVDPVLGVPFMFVESLGIGPIFFRRDVFLDLGGFDLRYSKPGEPGILLDHAICLKAWLSGWHVGLFEAPSFRRYVGGQGTLIFGKAERNQNKRKNMRRLRENYAQQIPEIDKLVESLNRGLNVRVPRPASK